MEQSYAAFCEKFLTLSDAQIPMVVVTQTHNRGSSPNNVGARMIVGHEGILFGTVGGGKIEAKCLQVAQEYLNSNEPVPAKSFTWNLQRDIGMTCGGEVTMFFEAHGQKDKWNIIVFGAGHISQELTRLLMKLDCNLTVVDQRQEWLDKLPDSKRVKKICMTNMKDLVKDLPENTFLASMTMGHASDTPVIFEALKTRNFPYVGVVGSMAKRRRIEKELREQGLPEERLKDFHCPMGEEFGRNSPVEIALSITAQLLRMRDELFQFKNTHT